MVSPLAQAIAFQNAVNPAQSGIAPTDVVGAYKLASDVAEKNYQAKLQQQMGMWGGLASLGAAGIRGFGPTLAQKWWGAAPAAASGDSSILTGGAALGIPQTDFNAANATLSGTWPTASAGELSDMTAAPAASSIAADFGTAAPGAGTVASDLAGTAGATGAADLGAGSIAGDLAATAPADFAAADIGAATMPDWLAAFLPFLA